MVKCVNAVKEVCWQGWGVLNKVTFELVLKEKMVLLRGEEWFQAEKSICIILENRTDSPSNGENLDSPGV